jgi:hypothetical protein
VRLQRCALEHHSRFLVALVNAAHKILFENEQITAQSLKDGALASANLDVEQVEATLNECMQLIRHAASLGLELAAFEEYLDQV